MNPPLAPTGVLPSHEEQKQADTDPKPDPMVFSSRSYDLDACINVLGQEFHVHSNVLKEQSEFFYISINWQDARTQTTTGAFKYEWVTKIDNDGTWGLIVAGSENANLDPPQLGRPRDGQIAAFENILNAMYNKAFRHYSDHGWDELAEEVELADFYRILPSLSRSVSDMMLHGNLRVGTRYDAGMMIFLAVKMHHAQLFRDCVCALASFTDLTTGDEMINTSEYYRTGDILRPVKLVEEVEKIVLWARAKIFEMIATIDQHKIHLFSRIPELEVACRSLHATPLGMELAQGKQLAYYTRLRQVMESMGPEYEDEFTEPLGLLKSLLSNNMMSLGGTYDSSNFERGRFLCAVVSDEDLPWEITQEDW